ncbi:Uncharacterized protein SCF082_LOCUS7108, partial [Durusdinium trenchii]
MDPTDAELNNMATLQHVADWAGTTGEVHEQLMDALGKPSKLRDIAFINRTVWDNVVAGLKIDTSSGTTTSERDLTPVEASRIEIFRRVTLLRLGANPDHVGSSTAPPVVSIGVSPLPSTSTPTSPTRKLKLSSVIDPTLDAEIIQLEQSEVARMYSTYKAKFGDHPSQEVEPSADQLSGINQMLRSGALPYCDFSVFGPHGLRQLRKAVFTSYVLNVATGEWSKSEAPGPDSIFNWEKSFRPCFSWRQPNPSDWTRMQITSKSFMGSLAMNVEKQEKIPPQEPVENTYQEKDQCLLVFSGKHRPGDLASYLGAEGWIVVIVDKVAPEPTDVLSEHNLDKILADTETGMYDVVGCATPCETLSPLRESPPGPRPLRSLDKPDGLPSEELTESERIQLKEANRLIALSARLAEIQATAGRAFWIENPDHKDKLDLWKTTPLKFLVREFNVWITEFDPCRFGAEVRKPTKLMSFHMNFWGIGDLRCNHPVQQWTRTDGSTYKAPHESLVQRWRTNDEGKKERASKALAGYPPQLNYALAQATVSVSMSRATAMLTALKGEL